MEIFSVKDFLDQKRLDVVLSQHSKVLSRSEAQRIIKSGNVRINQSDENIIPKRKVKKGDVISFTVLPASDLEAVATPGHLDIVFEDDHLIIVNKPSGMVVHPSAGHHTDTLVNYLLHHTRLPDTDPIRPGIVHRIDKDTSGLLLIAKNSSAHEHLASQFFNHSISRKYEALVWGVPKEIKGTINKPLGRHPSDRKKFAVREYGKQAITHWTVLQSYNYLSLIECKLETGRTHQIRVHMSSIGHPLVGDSVYGRFRNLGKKLSDSLITLLKIYPGQALHAKSLGFVHPFTNKWIEFESKRPSEMETIIKMLQDFFQKS
ncbi:RluA family pseudouridine synthase [bacterium]|nr:RluA family pseudouridine synthase [bacterium]